MASYAYCHRISEKKHLIAPSRTGTSINEVGAPEDGNVLHQIPRKRHFVKNFGYDESGNVITGESGESESYGGDALKKENQKYACWFS